MSRYGSGALVNMTIEERAVADGLWHNATLTSKFRTLRLLLDGFEVGDELDMSIVHDFMDPYLTSIVLGAANKDVFNLNENLSGELTDFSISFPISSRNYFALND